MKYQKIFIGTTIFFLLAAALYVWLVSLNDIRTETNVFEKQALSAMRVQSVVYAEQSEEPSFSGFCNSDYVFTLQEGLLHGQKGFEFKCFDEHARWSAEIKLKKTTLFQPDRFFCVGMMLDEYQDLVLTTDESTVNSDDLICG